MLVAFSSPADAAPAPLYRFADRRIDEASGIAVGVRSPRVDYVQNDSGDVARFFAVDASSGATAATITVPDAVNVDWEDIATAPDAAGRPSVWLADIGDNDAVRREVDVYRVDEPSVVAGARDRSVRASRPDVWRLRYPSGPTDAESLAVAPDGTAYIVTKSLVGSSVVYRVPYRPDASHVQTLAQVGVIRFRARIDAKGLLGSLGSLLATGASISRDGSLFVVRTYSDAFVWRLRDGDVGAALRAAPDRVPLALAHPVALTLWIVLGLIVLLVAAAFAGRWLIRRGLREPFVVRLINRVSDRIVEAVKRPITIAVLDEVASVLQTGNYTRNIASALEENREEIKEMVAEKIKDDPTAGAINLLPFHDRIIAQASETTLRVILEVLADPRTDELVSDMLRDNITQIRQAVREQS